MSDYERYGDYNSVDEEEEEGHRPSPVWKIVKITLLAVLLFVCLTLAARLIISGYYPRAMRSLYMTDALKAYRESSALHTERIEIDDDFRFDDPKFASFCADNLIVERKAGALQLSVRMTDGTFEELARRLGIKAFDYSGRAADYFDFSLLDSLGNRYHPVYAKDDSYFWYHATKLCFDGVDFARLDAEKLSPDKVVGSGADTVYLDSWIRLEVYYTAGGQPDYSQEPYAIMLIYMNIAETPKK